jgi:hypothetical protein
MQVRMIEDKYDVIQKQVYMCSKIGNKNMNHGMTGKNTHILQSMSPQNQNYSIRQGL